MFGEGRSRNVGQGLVAAALCSLEHIQHMRVFESQGLVHRPLLSGVALLVINKKNVAQGAVDEVKAQVAAHFVPVGIVLDEGAEKHLGIE